MTVTAYGHKQEIRHVTEVSCLWYGSWRTRPVRLILSRDEDAATGYDLALVTADPAASPAALVTRYAARWAIEQAFAHARNVLGAGEARNRVKIAVERTVPFAMLAHTIIIIWPRTRIWYRGRPARPAWRASPPVRRPDPGRPAALAAARAASPPASGAGPSASPPPRVMRPIYEPVQNRDR